LQNVEYLIRGDIGVLPYVLYENFPDELDTNYKFKRGKNNTNLIDTYLAINKYFIDASTFEESAYQSLDWSLLSYANALRMKSIFTGMIELEKKATHKDVKYRFSQILSKMSHKNIMAKKVRTVSASMNVSNTSTLVAVDMNLQTLQNMQNVKKSPLEKTKKEKGKKITSTLENDLIQEKTCVINTYEKYFV
jgi:hypothetical protein